MTKKSDFKKIIRARMAKTGESYAAARAVLLAEGERRCQECGDRYSENTWLDSHYFNPPYDYQRGYLRYCLGCWLGVGSKDFPTP